MPLGLAAVIFVVAVTVTLIIVTNKKLSKIIRIAAGIFGGIITLLSVVYIFLALIFIGAV
jgi:hypothetical protein